jgi:hypothetical protein
MLLPKRGRPRRRDADIISSCELFECNEIKPEVDDYCIKSIIEIAMYCVGQKGTVLCKGTALLYVTPSFSPLIV